jgi:uncharacterized OB-fold protein
VLRVQRCNRCHALFHPPVPACRYCRSEDISVADTSGRGVVIGVTVNYQQWDPRFPAPFVIATVALEEDPRVRGITNLIGVDPEAAQVGMRVRLRFEAIEDVWLPVFEPTADEADELPSDETDPASHRQWVRPRHETTKFEDRVAISGIGMWRIGRRLMQPPRWFRSSTIWAYTRRVVEAPEWRNRSAVVCTSRPDALSMLALKCRSE